MITSAIVVGIIITNIVIIDWYLSASSAIIYACWCTWRVPFGNDRSLHIRQTVGFKYHVWCITRSCTWRCWTRGARKTPKKNDWFKQQFKQFFLIWWIFILNQSVIRLADIYCNKGKHATRNTLNLP